LVAGHAKQSTAGEENNSDTVVFQKSGPLFIWSSYRSNKEWNDNFSKCGPISITFSILQLKKEAFYFD